ncbi:MAG: DUF3307 domain-containing protein [Marinifilaceae bacterium]|jgi:hypothetical protein|nr:DUF3307 domain-containing protein [Marinifilaceae bacterium]
MFDLILKIVICHLLGDFVFQTNKMVKNIDDKKLKSSALYLHFLIHFILILLFTKFESRFILPAFILSISHLAIDISSKILLKNKIPNISKFVLDQLLHFISIVLFIRYFYQLELDFSKVFNTQGYLYLTCFILITSVASIIIKKAMQVFDYKVQSGGLREAGKYIGMLERLFVFLFVISSFWQGIGFLLAAKSIFRFGDLRENKDRKLTEYILIGSFLSFGFAVLVGKLFLFVQSNLVLK